MRSDSVSVQFSCGLTWTTNDPRLISALEAEFERNTSTYSRVSRPPWIDSREQLSNVANFAPHHAVEAALAAAETKELPHADE